MYNSLFLYCSLPALLYFNNHKFLSKAERKGGFAWLQSQRNAFLTVQAKFYLHNLVSALSARYRWMYFWAGRAIVHGLSLNLLQLLLKPLGYPIIIRYYEITRFHHFIGWSLRESLGVPRSKVPH